VAAFPNACENLARFHRWMDEALVARRGGVAFAECWQAQLWWGAVLDGGCEFGEGRWKPVSRVGIHADFVVASAEVLDEGLPRAGYSC
jgi:hypothetical protein